MRQVGPDHMQSEDLTQPRLDLCSITKSGRGMETGFLSRSNKIKTNDRQEERADFQGQLGEHAEYMTRRNGGRLPACLLRAWTSVSQATPRNGLPPAFHEKPHCVQHNCGFQLERTGGTCGSLRLDLSGRGLP